MGAVGVGLVWGWLTGMLGGRVRRAWLTFSALFVATAAVVAEIVGLSGLRGGLLFLGSAALTSTIHVDWRRRLLARVRETELQEGRP